jgi:hypothetical protein
MSDASAHEVRSLPAFDKGAGPNLPCKGKPNFVDAAFAPIRFASGSPAGHQLNRQRPGLTGSILAWQPFQLPEIYISPPCSTPERPAGRRGVSVGCAKAWDAAGSFASRPSSTIPRMRSLPPGCRNWSPGIGGPRRARIQQRSWAPLAIGGRESCPLRRARRRDRGIGHSRTRTHRVLRAFRETTRGRKGTERAVQSRDHGRPRSPSAWRQLSESV